MNREIRMSYARGLSPLRIAAASSLLWVWGAGGAFAQDESTNPQTRQGLDMDLIGGISTSDNIARVPVDEEDGTITSLGTRLTYLQDTRRIKADVDVDANYQRYSDDVFDDDVVGGANAKLTLGVLPEKFLWQFEENFGQLVSDPFAAETPENRENINYFTTGPDLLFKVGGAFSLNVGARYSDVAYETSNADGHNYGGFIALNREISSVSHLSLNLDGRRYEFDDQVVNPAYDRYQAYLGYTLNGSRTELVAEAGYTQLEQGDEKPDGMLARLSVTRRLSRSALLSLSFGQEFSAAGDQFRFGQDMNGSGSSTSSVLASGDPFTNRYATLRYEFDRNRTTVGASVQFESERYETSTDQDRDLMRYSVYARRQLSPVIELSIFGELESQDFRNTNFEDDDLRAGAYLNWMVGRLVALRFQFDHFDYDTTLVGSEFTENRATLFMIWSPLQRR